LGVVLAQIYTFYSGEISLVRCDGYDGGGRWRATLPRGAGRAERRNYVLTDIESGKAAEKPTLHAHTGARELR
jgi:hypothetical protein